MIVAVCIGLVLCVAVVAAVWLTNQIHARELLADLAGPEAETRRVLERQRLDLKTQIDNSIYPEERRVLTERVIRIDEQLIQAAQPKDHR